MSARKLHVDLDALFDGATGPSELGDPYLDLASGSVVWRSDFMDDDDELARAFETEPDRFAAIPRYESRDEFELMRHFADSCDEVDVRDKLDVALGGKGSFSRFREVIRRHPDLQARWDEARNEALLDHVKAWLAGIGIEPSYARRQVAAVETKPSRPPAPPIALFDVLLLGAPGCKREVVEGRVSRHVSLPGPSDARCLFRRLARELCEHHGVAWRNRFIEGKSSYEIDRSHLFVEDSTVRLEVEVPRATWDAFSR